MEHEDAARQIADIGREFYRRGWVLGTSGNFSAVLDRDPLRIAITESSADKGKLSSRQILQIDEHGTVIEPKGAKASAEMRIHLAVIRKTGAASVLHTHSVWSTMLSDERGPNGGFSGGFWLEGYEMLKGLAGVETHEHREWIPIIENSQDTTLLAKRAEAHLTETPMMHAFLIQRHGLYTWGRDLAEATRHVEILEFLMEVLWRSYEYRNRTAPFVARNQ